MVGTSSTRPLITILAMLSSLIAEMSASVVVTHFSAVFMSASFRHPSQQRRSSASQRIGGGKAVARDSPLAVVDFLEDKQFLVAFVACGGGGVDLLGARRISPHKSPL